MRAYLILAAFLFVGLAMACGSTHRAATVRSTTIVFESDQDCDQTFYSIHPDGSGLRRLFTVPGCNTVYWKPDGAKVLVVQPHGIGPYIRDVRTGKSRPVEVKGLYDAINPPDQPWAPHGPRLLIAQGSADFSADKYIVYNPATHDWPLVDVSGAIGVPVWAADGKSIVFPTNAGIATASARGGPKTVVRLPHGFSVDSVGVSADGKWISFANAGERLTELYVMHPNGKGLHRIARVDSGVWSPAGERFSYQDSVGVHVVDLTSGRTTLVARPHGAVVPGTAVAVPVWSPDGKWLEYVVNDLGFGAPSYTHNAIWVVRADGRDAHAVTHAFPGVGNARVDATVWLPADLGGKPVPSEPLVEPQRNAVTTTDLPIVALGALGALGDEVAVATGFGRREGIGVQQVPAPRGPIVRVGPGGRTSTQQLPKHCIMVSTIVLTGSQFGYVCDNSRYESADYTLWLGGKEIVSTAGGQGVGSFLGAPVTDGHTIAYSINEDLISGPPHYTPLPRTTRIYESHGSSVKLMLTLGGDGTLEAIDRGRIAFLRYGRHSTIVVLGPGGTRQTFRFNTDSIVGAAFDGGRLVVSSDEDITIVDLATGRRQEWPRAYADTSYGSAALSVRRGLAAYVAGAAVHVMRLSDGHEVVLDTPGATSPVIAQFATKGLFYAYNEEYSKAPGRVGFLSYSALDQAISAKGRKAP